MARRGCEALLVYSRYHHIGEACIRQLTTYQRGIVIAVRRACQEAWMIVRKDFRQRVRHIVLEHILLNTIPYVEQEIPFGLEDPLCFTVAQLSIGEEHDS